MPENGKQNRLQTASAQAAGIQEFYKLKLGYKPSPLQMQVEQPSGNMPETVPSYLQVKGMGQGGSK